MWCDPEPFTVQAFLRKGYTWFQQDPWWLAPTCYNRTCCPPPPWRDYCWGSAGLQRTCQSQPETKVIDDCSLERWVARIGSRGWNIYPRLCVRKLLWRSRRSWPDVNQNTLPAVTQHTDTGAHIIILNLSSSTFHWDAIQGARQWSATERKTCRRKTRGTKPCSLFHGPLLTDGLACLSTPWTTVQGKLYEEEKPDRWISFFFLYLLPLFFLLLLDLLRSQGKLHWRQWLSLIKNFFFF